MPGTESSPRPGGNLDIEKYGFKTDRDEPLRSRLQLRVPDSMKQHLDQRDNWQEFVRQAISEKLKRVLLEQVLLDMTSKLLKRELTPIEKKLLDGIPNDLTIAEIAKITGYPEKVFDATARNLIEEIGDSIEIIDKIKNRIETEERTVAERVMDMISDSLCKHFHESPSVPYEPLLPGIYTLECLGDIRKPGKQFFLDGLTREGKVELAPWVDRYYSGTIWEIIYNEAEGIYWLKCLGRIEGKRFLNGEITRRELTLVKSAEDTSAEVELDKTTKWKAFQVPNEPQTFKFSCYSSDKHPFYLDGHTSDNTVGLLEQADIDRSGTRWKVEPVSEETLQEILS